MTRFKVLDSDMIASFSYDHRVETLAVIFTSSPLKVYTYRSVPKDLVLEMMRAQSVGRYFAQYIKPFPARYPFTKRDIPATEASNTVVAVAPLPEHLEAQLEKSLEATVPPTIVDKLNAKYRKKGAK